MFELQGARDVSVHLENLNEASVSKTANRQHVYMAGEQEQLHIVLNW